eukprot:6206679-Pleurochrysis_carterae.AAC.1
MHTAVACAQCSYCNATHRSPQSCGAGLPSAIHHVFSLNCSRTFICALLGQMRRMTCSCPVCLARGATAPRCIVRLRAALALGNTHYACSPHTPCAFLCA